MGTLTPAAPGGEISNRCMEDLAFFMRDWGVFSGDPEAHSAVLFAFGESQSVSVETTGTITGERTLRFIIDFDGDAIDLDFGGDDVTITEPGLYDFQCAPASDHVTFSNSGLAVVLKRFDLWEVTL